MMISQIPTEQQKNVEQTKASKKAFGKRVSALNARPANEVGNPENEGEFKSVGGHMFSNPSKAAPAEAPDESEE